MAIFECIHTGGRYEWSDKETIETMRKHSEYKEVVPVEKKPAKPSKTITKELS
jgi:hypothetical protein